MSFLSEFVYGGLDGVITTFSIVSGAGGGELARKVILILGISNVLSDGFSMGVGRYLSTGTEIDQGLLIGKSPLSSAAATILSFIFIGMIPIIPFFKLKGEEARRASFIASMCTFIFIGIVKGYMLRTCVLSSVIEVLALGLMAAAISYYIGKEVNRKIKEEEEEKNNTE